MAVVIRDKRVLYLIGEFLRRGGLADGLVAAKELDERGHSYRRYADDGNIYVSSRAAAERTLALEGERRQKRSGEGLGT
jgi:retron-type reverse transcriptase